MVYSPIYKLRLSVHSLNYTSVCEVVMTIRLSLVSVSFFTLLGPSPLLFSPSGNSIIVLSLFVFRCIYVILPIITLIVLIEVTPIFGLILTKFSFTLITQLVLKKFFFLLTSNSSPLLSHFYRKFFTTKCT